MRRSDKKFDDFESKAEKSLDTIAANQAAVSQWSKITQHWLGMGAWSCRPKIILKPKIEVTTQHGLAKSIGTIEHLVGGLERFFPIYWEFHHPN